MGTPRIGFVTGIETFWRHQLLKARYAAQRLTGVNTPDVYALPHFLADGFEFIRNGQPVSADEFDLIFSELNASDAQLEYLDSLVDASTPPVAVVPGPPEIISAKLTHKKLLLVKQILLNARHVLAYSSSIAEFYNGLIGQDRCKVIPWPFDYDATRALAGAAQPSENIRVVLNVPLRFEGHAGAYPWVLKACLLDVLSSLPAAERSRFTFHTFVYSAQDAAEFEQAGFARDLAITLEPRRRYAAFVRFLGGCDAVVNLTSSHILGRITFFAAALDKPGVFTANAEINTALYQRAIVRLMDPCALRPALAGLLNGLLRGAVPERFKPDTIAAKEMGDFEANAKTFSNLIA